MNLYTLNEKVIETAEKYTSSDNHRKHSRSKGSAVGDVGRHLTDSSQLAQIRGNGNRVVKTTYV